MRRLDAAAYLARLELDDPGPPSVESLFLLHRAHVERVPYENLEIQLGRPTTIVPRESAERIVERRRGGYCYHLNGAFSELLLALGYRVTRHLGGVQTGETAAVSGNHMALTVGGLPHETCPSGAWLVDVGLGSAVHEPLPLHEGVYRQGPFAYGVRPSAVETGGWRLDHDRELGFVGMDFSGDAADVSAFEAMHQHLSTAPESGFVRVATAQRRDADGVDVLRGLVLTRFGANASVRVVESQDEWFAVLDGVFGLALEDVSGAERERLWARVAAAHAEYEARPGETST